MLSDWLELLPAIFVIAVCICGLALLQAPLGMCRIAQSIVLPVAPYQLWRLLDPRNPDQASAFYEIKDREILRANPLIIKYQARPQGSHENFSPTLEVVSRLHEGREIVNQLIGLSANEVVEIPGRQSTHIEAHPGGCKLTLTLQTQITGLASYESHRMALKHQLVDIQLRALGQQLDKAPLFRWIGGRYLALALIAAIVMLALSLSLPSTEQREFLSILDSACLLALAALVHECGRILGMVAAGYRLIPVRVFPGFSDEIATRLEDRSIWERVCIALAGPGLCALLSFSVFVVATSFDAVSIALPSDFFIDCQLGVILFNIIPWAASAALSRFRAGLQQSVLSSSASDAQRPHS